MKRETFKSNFSKTLLHANSQPHKISKAFWIVAGLLAASLVPAAALGRNQVQPIRVTGEPLKSLHAPDIINQKAESIMTDDVSSQSVKSSSSTQVSSDTYSADSDQNVKVEVNGQPIAVPENGTIHKVIQDSDGETSIDMSVSSQNRADGQSSSSSNIQINSKSKSYVNSDSSP